MLKASSFVLACERAVCVRSPYSLKSLGGSQLFAIVLEGNLFNDIFLESNFMFEEILHLKHFFFSEKDSKLSKSVWESNELDLIIYLQTGICRGNPPV